MGHDTCGCRIRPLLCRLELSRPGERVGAPGAKSLSNMVEMRPDSMHGHSAWIRITCASRAFFRKECFHEYGVCVFTREGTTDALFVCHGPLVTQTRKSQSGTQNTLYDPTAFSAREHLHATIDTWGGYRQFRDGFGCGR